MPNALAHLPQFKQQQINDVANIIREVVQPEKIILFGSYATNTWVEDEYIEDGIRYSYNSDYDFLVVTKGRQEKDYILSDKIVNRARSITKIVVNPIILEIDYINEGLEIGQYFFTDIINDGIVLHDTGNTSFAEPRILSQQEQKVVSQNYFNVWFNRAADFLEIAEGCFQKNKLSLGAFQLHQATENFYNTVLLVCTGYKPKTHSLDKLRQYAKPWSKELFTLFPIEENPSDCHLFDLLRRGYIDARYKYDYTVTEEELHVLIKKIERMRVMVRALCVEKITSSTNKHQLLLQAP